MLGGGLIWAGIQIIGLFMGWNITIFSTQTSTPLVI
jgi:hypothetical protein